MNEEFPHTTAGWLRKQAAVARTITQEQIDGILWTLGHPVGTCTSWTPELLAKHFEACAEQQEKDFTQFT